MQKKDIQKIDLVRDLSIRPTKYKIVNKTGKMELSIFLNDNYKIRYCGRITTELFDVSGELKIEIYRTGNVCIWYGDRFAEYKDRIRKKYSTGLVLDTNIAEEICDYIDKLKELSEYMKEKYVVKKRMK